MRDMPDELQASLDASDPKTPWPGENRSVVYRHCFEVPRREMEGRHWPAQEARERAARAYEADMRPVPEMPRGRGNAAALPRQKVQLRSNICL